MVLPAGYRALGNSGLGGTDPVLLVGQSGRPDCFSSTGTALLTSKGCQGLGARPEQQAAVGTSAVGLC